MKMSWLASNYVTSLLFPLSSLPSAQIHPYGQFPLPEDPFHFIPCTNASIPPSLDDNNADRTWAALYDPNPAHWSWGNRTTPGDGISDAPEEMDEYSGRGIYLCGYLDLPLDYHNDTDERIVRLAVAKYQVSDLARVDSHSPSSLDLRSESSPGHKSERTIVVNPGGPGGSGTFKLWKSAEQLSARLSDGRFDVLAWDPRGVNMSLPAVSCFPDDARRDRWSLVSQRYREAAGTPEDQLALLDAMNNASFAACRERIADLGRFVSTSVVARDLDEIRERIGEEELTGYFISYGTGIAQTYANMFPRHVGRMILDGVEYVKDHRLTGGFGYTALDNVTDAWHDGFLGECVRAGPGSCALAKLVREHHGDVDTAVDELQDRMEALVRSLISRPLPAYTAKSGPSLITYSVLVNAIYQALYRPQTWPEVAQMLYELEAGNTTLAAEAVDKHWKYDPSNPISPGQLSDEDDLANLVICADSYDAPEETLSWWSDLWASMTARSWIAGNSRFQNVFPCRHFNRYWRMNPADVYRGDLNKTLKHPVLLIAEPYDPATPLRNARRLADEMRPANARLVAHRGYGHSSQWDVSGCTDAVGKAYILHGELPKERETDCYADGKPYLPKLDD
jgi:pimeloyl-ACP methyl ester carboxylesterase